MPGHQKLHPSLSSVQALSPSSWKALIKYAMFTAMWPSRFNLQYSSTNTKSGEDQKLSCAVPQALITVSNHVAALDDPLLTAALVPAGALLQPSALRWTLCATDRCFTSKAATTFFRAAKVACISIWVSHSRERAITWH